MQLIRESLGLAAQPNLHLLAKPVASRGVTQGSREAVGNVPICATVVHGAEPRQRQ